MPSLIPNRYQHYMDVSGVVNETVSGHEYVTVAGVCVLPDSGDAVRKSASSLPKWGNSTFEHASAAADLICGTTLAAVALTLFKDTTAWADFWSRSKQYRGRLAQTAHDRTGAAFTKAANVLKYMLFGDCSAALLGETVKRVGKPTLLGADRLSAVQLQIVCDTDIQGEENISVFQYLWKHLEGNQPLINELGLSEHVSSVAFATEQEEPLLLLADHLAGAFQAVAGGASRAPRRMTDTQLACVVRKYTSSNNLVHVDSTFDVPHEAIFGETRLWQLLWPDA